LQQQQHHHKHIAIRPLNQRNYAATHTDGKKFVTAEGMQLKVLQIMDKGVHLARNHSDRARSDFCRLAA
jgi:hypothetical protein